MHDALPPFLDRLGLDLQADERAIRRAYARQLKQIDQQADPAGFQALREAYAAALVWRAHAPLDLPEADERAPQPAPAPVQARTVPPSEPPARAALQALQDALASGELGTRDAVRRWLDARLDSERLIDMDARFLFEWGVAVLLAEGWRPGNELLLAPAMDSFGWREDRIRLAAFGHAGRIVDAALAELEHFDSQHDQLRRAQRDLIRRLRHGGRPGASELLRRLPQLRQLAQHYPNWLHLITDVRNIGRWQDWARQVPRWRRWLVLAPQAVPAPTRAGSLPWGWGFIALMLVSAIIRAFQPGATPASGPASLHIPADALPAGWDALGSSVATLPPPAAAPRSYGQAVRDAVLPHIVFSGPVSGNPAAEVQLWLSADGRVQNHQLIKPSGNALWDAAVLRAVARVPRLPVDHDGKAPPQMVISFRPKA